MTADEFRKMALSHTETEERSHMNHPDFRVRGKIFATLGYPAKDFAMVKLTPETQRIYVRDDPKTFTPVPGVWGLRGGTHVHLMAADRANVRQAIADAWKATVESAASKVPGRRVARKPKLPR
jgi:hypothetical protein